MIINASNNEQPASIISLQDTKLNNVEGFKYLGAHLQHQEPSTGDTELNYRISTLEKQAVWLMNFRGK